MFRCLTSLLGLTTKISLETMATIAVANAPCCAEPVDDDSSKPPENVGTRAVPTWATKSVPGHPYFTATGASPREGSARLNQHAPATAAEMISSQTQPLEKEIDFLSQLDPQVRAFMRWLSLHPSLQTTGYYAPTWNHLDPEQRLMVLGCALMAGFSIRKSGVVKGVSDCLYCQTERLVGGVSLSFRFSAYENWNSDEFAMAWHDVMAHLCKVGENGEWEIIDDNPLINPLTGRTIPNSHITIETLISYDSQATTAIRSGAKFMDISSQLALRFCLMNGDLSFFHLYTHGFGIMPRTPNQIRQWARTL